ncbi:AAA family ATPase [Stutzerimonas azotifigens]|uniref:AAA family ATPase n=1 Tax=Stutzerimonas azotifigens TaxID=291995 RepID=A0ABR5Z0Q4_9GAMM|nr:AAA family ATPase [Stutzerimonas azotifigens]MBA1273765.1 AAA family ATPase [Stutzerimonas azotifigens]
MTSLSADESYLSHYGFSHDPFAARVPGFKFFPAQRKPVLGQLHHLARYSQLLLVVTGPAGSGKTLLRQALVASTNKQTVQSVVVALQDATGPAEVLQQVAQSLGVKRADFDGIMAQIIQLALTGQEVYLLFDDAELLSDDAVELLLRLAAGNPEGRPHVFLFGKATLVARLEVLADGEERYHAIELQPYDEDETRDYLAARLEGADSSLEVLSEQQVEGIHAESGGWPGKINQVAREALIEAMRVSRKGGAKGAGFALPKKHLLAAAAVLMVVALALVFRGGSDESELAGDEAGQPRGTAIEFAGNNQPVPLPLASDPQPVMREPLAAASGGEEEDYAGSIDEPQSQPEPPVPAPSRPVEAPRQAVNEAPPAPAPAPQTPAQAQAPQRPVAATSSAPAAAPAPAQASTPAAAGGSADWYAGQPGSNYLLQVLGTRSEKSAQAVVQEHGSGYRYFTKQHEGRPLYVVTYGSFANRAAAQSAIASLPSALQAGKPWPRAFSSVQQEIQAR